MDKFVTRKSISERSKRLATSEFDDQESPEPSELNPPPAKLAAAAKSGIRNRSEAG